MAEVLGVPARRGVKKALITTYELPPPPSHASCATSRYRCLYGGAASRPDRLDLQLRPRWPPLLWLDCCLVSGRLAAREVWLESQLTHREPLRLQYLVWVRNMQPCDRFLLQTRSRSLSPCQRQTGCRCFEMPANTWSALCRGVSSHPKNRTSQQPCESRSDRPTRRQKGRTEQDETVVVDVKTARSRRRLRSSQGSAVGSHEVAIAAPARHSGKLHGELWVLGCS